MRRRPSRLSLWFFGLLSVALASGARLEAQTGLTPEAIQFLLPIGARSVGSGQAVVAGGGGAEGISWNPAAISRGPREFAFSLAEQANGISATDANIAIVWPVARVGAFAMSLRYTAEQDQQSVDPAGRLLGTFNINSIIAAGTFSAPFGNRLAAGITLKFLQQGAGCTGSCDLPAFPPRTAGADVGLQYFLTKDSTVTLGASLLNTGFRLQVNDAPQADQLPTRALGGVSIAPRFSNAPKELATRFEADVIKRVSGGGPGYRFGGELSWQNQYVARVGYQLYTPTGSGPTVGVGLATQKLHIDFAQVFTDLGVGLGKPTFLSLRYLF
jgi:hypothetical protein